MKQIEDTVTLEMTLPCPGEPEPGTARPEGLTLVHMGQVDVHKQVRTETGMDDASLAELGESIRREGLLQLPLLRHAPGGLRFIVIAGHRRIEAMRRAGFERFYAIVGQADDAKAFTMQLAENIQRQELSLKEIAAAVRKLHDSGKNMDEIGQIVKKSKAWVSKHLAVSCEDFSYTARWMLERGECEDLEILNGINQLDKLGRSGIVQTLRHQDEPITRDQVRELVAQAKEEKRAQEEEAKAAKKAKSKSVALTAEEQARRERQEEAERTNKLMQPWWRFESDMDWERTEDEAPEALAQRLTENFSEEIKRAVELYADEAWKNGKALADMQPGIERDMKVMAIMSRPSLLAAAVMLGLHNQARTFQQLAEMTARMVCAKE